MESQRSGGWFHGVGSECSSPSLDICRGFLLGVCPQSLRSQPSWPQTLATRAVPRHRPTSRPLCPDNSQSRRGDHQRSLSPTNRIRQRAESFASNRSNVPPPVESSISSQVSISRCKPNIPYHFARRSSIRLSFQITYPRFEYFSFGATIRPFFPFLRARYSKLRG